MSSETRRPVPANAVKVEVSMVGVGVPLASAAGLFAVLLGVHRSGIAIPSTLLLFFIGLALCPFGRAPHRMSLWDWVFIGPYLLAVGSGFGRDLQQVNTPIAAAIASVSAILAVLAPQTRRPGPDAISFVLTVLLYGATLMLRHSIPGQELALFAGAAVLRVGLSRARRLQIAARGRGSKVAWMILAPATRAGLLAAALVLSAESVAAGVQFLREAFRPEIGELTKRLQKVTSQTQGLAQTVRAWARRWVPELREPPRVRNDGPEGVVEGLISGQDPVEMGPVPGLDFPSIKVLDPEKLRFERDVRERIELPGIPEDLVLASVKSDRPLGSAPYLRRTVFEVYEDGAWSLPSPGWAPWPGRAVIDVPGSVELWVTSRPGKLGEIFVPSPFLGTMTETPLYRDRAGNLRSAVPQRGPVTISAVSHAGELDLSVSAGPRLGGALQQVPEALLNHPAFRQVLLAVRRRSSRGVPLTTAAAAYCRETFRYTRQPHHNPDADPVLEFLRTGRGFCQHYASLCALVLRAEGVSCRLGAGLAFGASRGEAWLYGLDNGHAWVEVWLEGIGWVPLDPTAGAINLDTGAPSPPLVGASSQRPPNLPGDDPRGVDPPREDRGNPLNDTLGERGTGPGPGPSSPPDRIPTSAPASVARVTPTPVAAGSRVRPGAGSNVAAARPSPSAVPTRPVGPAAARSGAAGEPSSPAPKSEDAQTKPLDPVAQLRELLASFFRFGDWLALGAGALLSLGAVLTLRRRARVEEVLGERASMTPAVAVNDLEKLTRRLMLTRSPHEIARLLFELFSHQMAAWGYGRAQHETERDFAMAAGRALGGASHASMERAVSLVEEFSYGGVQPQKTHLADLDDSLMQVLRAFRRRLGLRPLRGVPLRRGWLATRTQVVS